MKKILLFVVYIALSAGAICAQDTDFLEQTIRSKYLQSPFEGVKIVNSGTTKYLIAMAITSTERKEASVLNRLGMIKARREALKFLNGSVLTSETILNTGEITTGSSVSFYEEYIDKIRENAQGYIDGMSVLTNWYTPDNKEFVIVIYSILNQ